MLKYWIYYKVSLKELFAYKADFIIYIVANMVFFFAYFALWKTVYTSNGVTDINSYSLTNTITYYFIVSFLFRLDPTNAMYLNDTVWGGYFTNDLIKPWSAILVDITYTLAELFVRVLLYIPFIIFIYFTAASYIAFPNLLNGFYFVVTAILGIFLNISFYQIFHALCFHFGDQEGNISLVSYLIAIPAGGFLPLVFFPETFRNIFHVLPFRFLFDVPANIFLGKLSTPEILSSWGQMILWTIGFFIIFYIIFKKGLKKYTGTGR